MEGKSANVESFSLSLFFVFAVLAALGLHCNASVSHCGGFSCCGARALECGLSSGGAWAELHHGMLDLPESGIEPVSPALTCEFFTTEPAEKPWQVDS